MAGIAAMQHIEFFHIDHFENDYHRVKPIPALEDFIDFFWETKFEDLWEKYPKGFSDALFPNIGYTYLINLGTPFIMQVEEQKFQMKSDGFLPRHKAIECYHQPGNKLFGIKFKISPVIFEKKVNFAEYREYIFPLSYLIDTAIIEDLKKVISFDDRIQLLNDHFQKIVNKHSGSLRPVQIVKEILDHCSRNNAFDLQIEELAAKYHISTRTLQRYFETATGISSKKALQIMRARKAAHHLATTPQTFHYSVYGYYDHSHFYKHLKQFLHKTTLSNLQPHLKLLKGIHK
jgi:AraC-like DNA-binding protein